MSKSRHRKKAQLKEQREIEIQEHNINNSLEKPQILIELEQYYGLRYSNPLDVIGIEKKNKFKKEPKKIEEGQTLVQLRHHLEELNLRSGTERR